MPAAVADELTRLVHRWRQLPVDQALARMPRANAVVSRLAALVDTGDQPPDLGPAVVMDQLVVTAYDACAVGRAEEVLALLSGLRRDL